MHKISNQFVPRFVSEDVFGTFETIGTERLYVPIEQPGVNPHASFFNTIRYWIAFWMTDVCSEIKLQGLERPKILSASDFYQLASLRVLALDRLDS